MTSSSDSNNDQNKTPDQKPESGASAFKHPLMAQMETDEKDLERKLTKGEMIREAFSLIFALQGMKKFQRAADQLENKPSRIVIAGFISIMLFMGFCYTAANLALQAAKKDKEAAIESRQENTKKEAALDLKDPLQSTNSSAK